MLLCFSAPVRAAAAILVCTLRACQFWGGGWVKKKNSAPEPLARVGFVDAPEPLARVGFVDKPDPLARMDFGDVLEPLARMGFGESLLLFQGGHSVGFGESPLILQGGHSSKRRRTTRLPRYTRDPVVGVWSEALGGLQEPGA